MRSTFHMQSQFKQINLHSYYALCPNNGMSFVMALIVGYSC